MDRLSSPMGSDKSEDSLFGSVSSDQAASSAPPGPAADPPIPSTSLVPPSIPGLRFFPSLLPAELTSLLVSSIADSDLFLGGKRDQVMLFGADSLPAWMTIALEEVRTLLRGRMDDGVVSDIFDSRGRGRQVIMNLYQPGQGITPHIDLPHRYDTPILSVSLLSGTSFLVRRPHSHATSPTGPPVISHREEHRFWVSEGSVMILDGEARWEWEHGIEAREGDCIADPDAEEGQVWRGRGTRVSLTFRWMKPGADIVGGEDGVGEEDDGPVRKG